MYLSTVALRERTCVLSAAACCPCPLRPFSSPNPLPPSRRPLRLLILMHYALPALAVLLQEVPGGWEAQGSLKQGSSSPASARPCARTRSLWTACSSRPCSASSKCRCGLQGGAGVAKSLPFSLSIRVVGFCCYRADRCKMGKKNGAISSSWVAQPGQGVPHAGGSAAVFAQFGYLAGLRG
jgi:hypothetical protein